MLSPIHVEMEIMAAQITSVWMLLLLAKQSKRQDEYIGKNLLCENLSQIC